MSHRRHQMCRESNEFTVEKGARFLVPLWYARTSSLVAITDSGASSSAHGRGWCSSGRGSGCCSSAPGWCSRASASSHPPCACAWRPPSGPTPTEPPCCAAPKRDRPAVHPSLPVSCWSCGRAPSPTSCRRPTSRSRSPRRDAPPPTGARPGARSPLRCAEPDAAVWRCRTTYHHAACSTPKLSCTGNIICGNTSRPCGRSQDKPMTLMSRASKGGWNGHECPFPRDS